MFKFILALVLIVAKLLVFVCIVAFGVKVVPWAFVFGTIAWIVFSLVRNIRNQQRGVSEPPGEEKKTPTGTGQPSSKGKENGRRREARRRGSQRQHDHGNYYELLGVVPCATCAEIKRAWRTLDYGQPLPLETRRAYHKAYRILSDPEERRKYDADLLRPKSEREQEQRQGWEQEEKRRQERENKRRQRQENERKQEQERKRRQERESRRRQKQEQEWRRERENQQRQKQKQQYDRERKQEDYRDAGRQKSSPDFADYYERLGIEQSSSQQDIKKAWKKYAKRWHPDNCKHPQATEIFQSGNEAYRILKDPAERRKFDAELQRNRGKQQRRNGQNSSRDTRQGNGQSDQQQSRRNPGGHFTGTWTKIKFGPLVGTWGVWVESLHVMKGGKALVRRRDGQIALVIVLQVLSRSDAKGVTLCQVQKIAVP